MRVTVVTARYPPMPGGVADHTLAWCRALDALGTFDLTVVTSPDPPSPARPRTASEAALEPGPIAANLSRIAVRPDRAALDRSSTTEEPGHTTEDASSIAAASGRIAVDASQTDWGLAGARTLRSAVERSKPDVVVVQYVPHAFSRRGGGLPTALMLRALTRRLDVPLVVNAHELYARWAEALHRAPWCLTQRLGVGVLAAASRALVVTVKARQQQIQATLPRWQDRILVVPNGPTVPPTPPNPHWRREHGVDDGVLVLATMGLGHWTKDISALEAAVTRLEAAGRDARLFVAGGMTVHHPRATHLGYLDPVAAGQLLSAADLFLLPLADGASGRRSSLISALAAGAPVVSTTGPDTDETLFPANAVRLIPAGDTDAFASAVEQLAHNPPAREALRAGARALHDQTFAWPVIARQWSKILQVAAS